MGIINRFHDAVLSLHGHPYYCVCPDVLSLVCDPLSGNGCGLPNHTVLIIYFCLFTSFILDTKKRRAYKVKSKSRFNQKRRSLALPHIALTRMLSSPACQRPLSADSGYLI
jgi:hypothetical protein